MVSVLHLISSSFTNPLGIIPRAPTKFGVTLFGRIQSIFISSQQIFLEDSPDRVHLNIRNVLYILFLDDPSCFESFYVLMFGFSLRLKASESTINFLFKKTVHQS